MTEEEEETGRKQDTVAASGRVKRKTTEVACFTLQHGDFELYKSKHASVTVFFF